MGVAPAGSAPTQTGLTRGTIRAITVHILTKALVRSLIVAGLIAGSGPLANAQQRFDTKIMQIGDAQVQTLVETGFFPDRQPVIFWHDPDWNIDLLLPASKDGAFSMQIRSKAGKKLVVALPARASQIISILRAPNDNAIVYTDPDGESDGIIIINLKTGTIIDDLTMSDTSISPNRRFVLFDNWISNWDDSVPHEFRLYDILRSPRENTCGYGAADPEHEKLDDFLRGIQVLPPLSGRQACSDNDEDVGWDFGTNFTWAADSTKVVFADMKGGKMTLVLITVPLGTHDLPKASVYVLKGAQDVCAGATDAAGEKNCDDHEIKSLQWDGNLIQAVFQHQFGTPLNLHLTVPISSFIPIVK